MHQLTYFNVLHQICGAPIPGSSLSSYAVFNLDLDFYSSKDCEEIYMMELWAGGTVKHVLKVFEHF